MYKASPNILSFFKESLWNEPGSKYFRTGTLYDLKQAFENNQQGHFTGSITHTALAVIARSPVQVDPLMLVDEGYTTDHAVDTGDGEYMSLDPIMRQAYEELDPGAAGFIYDSRFVMLVYRSAMMQQSDLSVVLINTSARASRIVKHSKNVSHTTVSVGAHDLQVGTDQAVGGGYMLPFIRTISTIRSD